MQLAGWAKARREPVEAALTPQINLPQPIARHGIALQEKPVVSGGGVYVRYAGAIDNDFTRSAKAG